MARTSRSVNARDRIDALEPRILLAADAIAVASQPGIGQPAQVASESPLTLREIHGITGVDEAHRRGITGLGQTVVVIDSGIAYDHAALGGGLGPEFRVVGGWDFTEENDADPYDDGPAGFHGTHVAGIIGSSDSTHRGVAPDVDLVALRVFNDMGRGKLSWLENSLQWVIEHVEAFDNPITTVNLSIGTDWNSTTLPDYAKLEDEFAELRDLGVFVAVAAGNSFDPDLAGLSYPAVSPYVVPVASQTTNGGLSSFSQRNGRVIVAPGEQISSTVPDYVDDFNGITDDFHAASGTSMASPYLAGASVLVRQAMQQAGAENITVDAVLEVLNSTAKEIFDPVTNLTYGVLDVGAAINSLQDNEPLKVVDLGRLSDLGTSVFIPPSHEASAVEFTSEFAGLWFIEARDGTGFTVAGVEQQSPGSTVISTNQSDRVRIELPATNESRELHFSQLVSVRGSRLTVRGTDEIDTITVDDSGHIELNGIEFEFAAESISRISIGGGGGSDHLVVRTHLDAAFIDFSPGYVHLSARPLALTGFDFAHIEVIAEGEANVTSFHGSSMPDRFFAMATHSWMENGEYLNEVRGTQIVTAWSEDTRDQAVFFDSGHSSATHVLPELGQVVGAGYDNRAIGVWDVVVHDDAPEQRQAEQSAANWRAGSTIGQAELVAGVAYVTDNSAKATVGVQPSFNARVDVSASLSDTRVSIAEFPYDDVWTDEEDFLGQADVRGSGYSDFARIVTRESRDSGLSVFDSALRTVAATDEPLLHESLPLEQAISDIAARAD